MFKRALIHALNDWKINGVRKPILLNGARQVGKTHLLTHWGAENFRKVHYVNFEIRPRLKELFNNSLAAEELIKTLTLDLGQSITKDDLIFFDEVQECPAALNSLKYFCEQMPDQPVCAAGSLLGVRLSSGSFPVGKVDEFELYPLTFDEFLSAVGEKALADFLSEQRTLAQPYAETIHIKLWELWKMYLVTGGLPEVVSLYCIERDRDADLLKMLEAIRNKQYMIINEYIKDMSKHAGKVNAMHLERIFRSIPMQLAKVIDGSVQRFQFKGVLSGVSQYSRLATAFDWLQGAGLIYKVPIIDSAALPLTQHTRENYFKVYLFDVGILGALGEIPPAQLLQFEFGTYKGYVTENYVIQALKARGIKSLYGWATGEAEVEFVYTDMQGVVPVEVKSGAVTQAKSLNQFIKRFKPHLAYIYGGTVPRDNLPVMRRPVYIA